MTPAKTLIVLAMLAATAPLTAQAGGPVLRPAWESSVGLARGARLLDCVAVGSRVLVGDERGGVVALDPATGALQWFVQAPGPLDFVPSDGGAIALASGPTVIVVDSATGRRLFETTSASAPAASPCSDGRMLFVPSLLDSTLVAWDMATGLKAWEFRFASPFDGPAQVCGLEGSRSVVVALDDGTLRAVPAQLEVPRGERWVARTGRVLGAPVALGGALVVATHDRSLVSLDASAGTLRWRRFTGDPPTSPVVVAGGLLAVATSEGLLGLRVEDGSTAWTHPGGGRPLGDVGGELLVRAGDACHWRAADSGRLLRERLPGRSVAAGGRLVELRDDQVVKGWARSGG
jgi:outer membrane protein assembly factor BamB